MYHWLSDALQESSTVVTANRRLARVLQAEHAQQQIILGKSAWPSPAICSWQDWLVEVVQSSTDPVALPTHINGQQSRLLWERCLQKELPDSTAALASLVKLSRDAWQRLADWRVSIGTLARAAQTDDQRLFARVAGRYLGILEREHWVDDAGLGRLCRDLICNGKVRIPQGITFAGFDRESPVVASIRRVLTDRACTVVNAPVPETQAQMSTQCFDNVEAEFRAAGAWARDRLSRNPSQMIAIISSGLEQQAGLKSRLLREGLVPGWQYGSRAIREAVNVSYGRKLIDFPAVSIALLLLSWLVRDLDSEEVGLLLRSPLVASEATGGRCRLELRLRQMPRRAWSPSMLTAAMSSHGELADVMDWQALLAAISKLRREIPGRASPAEWAVKIDEILRASQWPGSDTLDSDDFQLVNRWRELLNDLARLDLVSPTMTLDLALRRLQLMAADTVFQPQSEGARVQLLGPLEASGSEFDAVWISGMTAANWPPANSPSPLISRRLQVQEGMPDAEPSDTLEYAKRTLGRLVGCSPHVVLSYPRSADDAEQTPSALLRETGSRPMDPQQDPGWHVLALTQHRVRTIGDDRVASIRPGEQVAGGAATIQRQMNDPFAAYAVGRLGVKALSPQALGIPASLRGNLTHDALYKLYLDKPSRDEIASWTDDELGRRVQQALKSVFSRHTRNTDNVLFELLAMERRRLRELLSQFVRVDRERTNFRVDSVEREVAFDVAGVQMQLRVDRIDRYPDGALAVLDYKSGARRRLLLADGRPREYQLVAYAEALQEPVAALALVNIDSRDIGFDGAGEGFSDVAAWHDTLLSWRGQVGAACRDMSQGDVRINGSQSVKDARELNLLSRFTELRRDA